MKGKRKKDMKKSPFIPDRGHSAELSSWESLDYFHGHGYPDWYRKKHPLDQIYDECYFGHDTMERLSPVYEDDKIQGMINFRYAMEILLRYGLKHKQKGRAKKQCK